MSILMGKWAIYSSVCHQQWPLKDPAYIKPSSYYFLNGFIVGDKTTALF
jgi:hypothetical protein